MKRLGLFLTAAFFPLTQASACAVCFGAPNNPWNRGFFWAIVLLLSLPFLLMGSLVSLYMYHSRKHRRAQAAHP